MKRFWELFKRPPLWVILLVFLLTILAATASIIMAVLGFTEFWVYIIYGMAGTTLAYSVYIIVKFAPKIKYGITEMLRAFSFTRKFIDLYGFRALVLTTISLLINIAYTVFNAVLAFVFSSLWFGAIAIYHSILIALRTDTLLSRNKNQRGSFLRCGILIIVLSVFLSLAIWQMVANGLSFNYPSLTIYAFAAYAFYKLTTAIISLFKIQEANLTIKATKYISFADALVSILSLQTALLFTFSDETINSGAFNAATGMVVCLLTLAIGIIMLITYKKQGNKYERK